MISVTYMSTATVAFTDSELAELLRTVRERNHADGLTGVMLYAGGHFIQTLEGPQDIVEATLARIELDTRHRDIYIALMEQIDVRLFPDWSMGFESVDPDVAATLPGFNDYLAGNTISRDDRQKLGRPGVFHRVFRDNMR